MPANRAPKRRELIAKYTRLVGEKSPPADPRSGRAVFVKTCQQCHTLFGAGGKDRAGADRLEPRQPRYLLSNMLDPSAVMAKEYQPSVIVTATAG